MLYHQPAHNVPEIRTERVSRPRRLETKQAAAGSRNPDRAASVVAVREGNHSCCDSSGRPPAGAAARPRGVPRIAAWAKQPGLSGGQNAELGCVCLAQDDQSRPLDPVYKLTVVVRDKVAHKP